MSGYLQEMVAGARNAQAAVEDWTQEQVNEMVTAVGWAVYRRDHAEVCARSAVEETAMGIYEHKLLKHQKKTLGTLRDLHGVRSVGIIEEDEARGLIKFAKPVGVVGALTPDHQLLVNDLLQRPVHSEGTKRGHLCPPSVRQADRRADLRLHARRLAHGGRARGVGTKTSPSPRSRAPRR